MDNMDEVLTLKQMVLDLNRMLCRTWKNGLSSSEMDLEQAMDRVRNIVERATGCNDIPLEWYEYRDESFVGQIAASLNNASLNKKA
jgi:hypothetical protein